MEREFRFKKPSTSDETQRAIYEELSAVSREEKNHNLDTLKDYVREIYVQQKDRLRQISEERNQNTFSEDVSYLACGVLGIVLLFISANLSADYDWVREHSFLLFSAGIIFALLFISISVERTSLFRDIWKHTTPKLIASLLFTAAMIFATSISSGAINSVFGVDASAMPFARAYLAGILFFKLVSPLFILLIVPVVLATVLLFNNKVDSWTRSVAAVFVLCALAVGAYSYKLLNGAFADMEIPYKAYKLAHKLDFSDRALCFNDEQKKSSFLFIGPDQHSVLIDESFNGDESLEEFLKNSPGESGWRSPQNIKLLSCNIASHVAM